MVTVYGETKTLLILSLDLVWNELLWFVLVKDGGQTFILIGSDLTMTPEEMVSLYGRRFKIEVTSLAGFVIISGRKLGKFPKINPSPSIR